uniref:Uncharacterized protein n=1 Tax=Anopheles stephensi TaxID=30069 RepID=A0A182YC01_ANOST
MSDFERIRLVILGGAGVGKSCIIKRFLFKTYSDKYRPTVEDLYNREYDLGSVTLKGERVPCVPDEYLKLEQHSQQVDILDTSGEMQFPAMRRLSIATAHAFLLVYATTSEGSLGCIKQCFEEIREQRADFQDIPMVIVGNKYDLTSSHREVRIEDVSEWVFCELPKLK